MEQAQFTASQYQQDLLQGASPVCPLYIKHKTKNVVYEVSVSEYNGYQNTNWYIVNTHTEAFGLTTIRVPMADYQLTTEKPLTVKF